MKLHSHEEQQMSGSFPGSGKESIMESQSNHKQGRKSGKIIALALCIAVIGATVVEQFVHNRPDYSGTFAPQWISLVAAGFAAAGLVRLNGHPRWRSVQRTLLWSGLMLMIWVANGLPFDLLRMTPLMPQGVDWPGFVTRILALAAVIMLARLALADPSTTTTTLSSFLVWLRCVRAGNALSGSQDMLGAGKHDRTHVPWCSRQWLRTVVNCHTMDSGSRSFPMSGIYATLDTPWVVTDRRMVCHCYSRYDRAIGILVYNQQVGDRR